MAMLKTHGTGLYGSGRIHGHGAFNLSEEIHLPLPQEGGPTATTTGDSPSLGQGSHRDPRPAGGREDASEGMTSPQTLPDFERMSRRREQTQKMERGLNAFSSGSISDWWETP